MKYQILQGDNRTTLKSLPDNSIDAIVTDPPYGIDFLGKSWDANTGALETYAECLRVLKPGGHILAFSAARTYHHLAVTLEQAGFEIRDQIMWIYSSGFPKSQDIGKSIERGEKKRKDNALGIKRSKIESGPKTSCPKCNKTLNGSNQTTCAEEQCDLRDALAPADNEWAGWGTSLKPAHEPIALARKPIKLSIARNCQTHGVGALNIDACRVPFEDENDQPSGGENGWSRVGFNETPVEKYSDQKKKKSDVEIYLNNKRGPMERAKIADGENIGMFDGGVGYKAIKRAVDPAVDLPAGRFPSNVIGEIPNYQKYFYCPKVSRRERHIGHEMPPAMFGDVQGAYGPDGNRMAVGFDNRATGKTKKHDPLGHLPTTRRARDAEGNVLNYAEKKAGASATMLAEQFQTADGPTGNNHPTVKPIELMKYLIRLITPPGGVVLDPFNGSGSTGCAAVELGHEYIGCELDPAYVEIAERRIQAWYEAANPTTFNRLFDVE